MDISFVAAFLKMLFALALVLGLLIGSVYLLKRITASTTLGGGANDAIRVVATRYLGPKASVVILDVMGQFIVVGMSGTSMCYLTDVSDPVALEKLEALASAPARPVAVPPALASLKTALAPLADAARKRWKR